ncbi:hypothetical protein SHO565_64210 [Streptomyces sp. HO565]
MSQLLFSITGYGYATPDRPISRLGRPTAALLPHTRRTGSPGPPPDASPAGVRRRGDMNEEAGDRGGPGAGAQLLLDRAAVESYVDPAGGQLALLADCATATGLTLTPSGVRRFRP